MRPRVRLVIALLMATLLTSLRQHAWHRLRTLLQPGVCRAARVRAFTCCWRSRNEAIYEGRGQFEVRHRHRQHHRYSVTTIDMTVISLTPFESNEMTSAGDGVDPSRLGLTFILIFRSEELLRNR